MKAIRIHQFGGPEVMKLEELPIPDPEPGEVRVAVKVAGVNFVDIYQRSGAYKTAISLPYTLGLEGTGIVDAIGPGVAGFKIGDRVAWAGASGSYATHVLAPANRLVPLPPRLDFTQGAAAMLQGMTAHYLTHSVYPLKSGEVCLIHAAAGGVGLLLCQMAKRLGAKVFGTVSTEDKAKRAREAGAEEVILYTQHDFEAEVRRLTSGKGVDVVYDGVGKDTFEKSLDCLRPRGYMVLYGQSSGPVPPIDTQILNTKGALFLTRPSLQYYTAIREELLWRANDVFGWIESGALRLSIERVLPLAEAPEAHRLLAERETSGKIVLRP